MVESIRNAYLIFEQLNISVTALIVVVVLLSLAFLFSLREAASWFFKIDDLKTDIQSLHEVSSQLQSEIQTLQSLINEAKSLGAPASAIIATRPLSKVILGQPLH